jgi:RNA recognition motif-containing protein
LITFFLFKFLHFKIKEPETSRKIFVGRLSENLTSKDLQDYFSQYGQVIDVYIPKPFRAFGFVTFVEADIAQSLCGESHIIKGVSVHVSKADPKEEDNNHHGSHHYNNNSNSHYHHYNNSGNNYNNHGSGGGSGYQKNDGGPMHSRRFASGSGGSKSMGQLSNRSKMKYDHHSMHSGMNDLYDGRHNVRSPSHHGGGPGSNSGSNQGSNMGGPNGVSSHDPQMNPIMSIFNPMMAAFISQLTNGIQPSNQSQIEAAHNGAAAAAAAALGHGPIPPWNDYSMSNQRNLASGMGGGGSSGGGNYGGSSNSGPSRFKSDKF